MDIQVKPVYKTIVITLLLLGSIAMCIPFVWMILASFKPESEVVALTPKFWPQQATIENYVRLFTEMRFATYLWNTLVIVFFSFIGLFLNAAAGYAFAKFEFPGRNVLYYLVLGTMMIPSQVTMIPVYLLLNQMNLTNTMAGIVLPGMVNAFGIFLFRQFMTTIPADLIEASRLDGASELRTFFQLVIPIAKPIFAVQGILTFIGGWNSFLWPLIIANDENLYTLSVGLSLLKGQYGGDFAIQMAGASFMVVPIVILFIFMQRHIIEGYTISGMK